MKIVGISMTLALLLGTASLACSSSDDHKNSSTSSGGYTDHSSPYPDCDAIIKACHPYDVGEGDIHNCHDQGHEAHSEADCTPVKQKCLDICAAAAAGDAGTDGGAQ
jgi:hypothetical protein